MKVHFVENSGKEMANFLLSINVGWSHEPVGKRGISHFLEHAIFLGNDEYPTPDMNTGKFGVSLNGETLEDRTIYFFSSLKDDASLILPILVSLVYKPSFPEDKIYEEKISKIIPAIVDENDYYPWELAYELARNLIFEWDFRESMGTKEDLEDMGVSDLMDWHRRYYHSQNSILLLSPSLEIGEFDIPLRGEKPIRKKIKYDKRDIILERRIKNSEIVYAFPLENYDVKALLLSTLLGNYPTSIFWREFHTDAYMVDAKVEWHDIGGFFFYLGANTRDISSITQKFENFIENIQITEEEFEIAKKVLRIELLDKERSKYALYYLLKIDPLLKMGSFRKILEEMEKIERNEFLDYVRNILDLENLRYSAVL